MTFTCFGKVIEKTTRSKLLCLGVVIFFLCIIAIVALTAIFICKDNACRHEKGETTTTMMSVSTRSSISLSMMFNRITTNTASTRLQTSTLHRLSFWTSDSYFTTPRGVFDAAVFPDGRLMAYGGSVNKTSVTRVCDVYTSSPNWIAGPSMNRFRNRYTLTFFANKTKILAAGNAVYWNDDQQMAEVYDVHRNTWTLTPVNMTTTRYAHRAVLLKSEQIVIMEGTSSSASALSSAELFLPCSNSFVTTNSMNVARAYFTSTLLSDGLTVLVTGGRSPSSTSTTSAELYTSGSWTFTNNNMAESRVDHAAVLLQDGNVLIAGVPYNKSQSLASAEIYNTTTRTFIHVGSMKYPHAGLTLTLLPSGKVLATGGMDCLTATYHATCELFDPITQTWSDTRWLRTGRYYPVTVLLADSVLTMGGEFGGNNFLTSCEKYSL